MAFQLACYIKAGTNSLDMCASRVLSLARQSRCDSSHRAEETVTYVSIDTHDDYKIAVRLYSRRNWRIDSEVWYDYDRLGVNGTQ